MSQQVGELPRKKTNATRVLFWNIWKDITNTGDVKRNLPNFQKQVENIVLSPRGTPDVMVFAEHMGDQLSESNWKIIRENYDYIQEVKDKKGAPKRSTGLLIMAKKKPEDVDFAQNMPYWPKGTSEADIQKLKNKWEEGGLNYDMQKAFARITYTIGGKRVHIVPMHLNMPWLDMKTNTNCLDSILSSPSVGGKMPVSWVQKLRSVNKQGKQFSQICYGRSNPNFHQLKHFFDRMRSSESGINFEKDTVIVMGDMNFFDSKFAHSSKGYDFVTEEQSFQDAFHGSGVSTFPTNIPSQKGKTPLKIDHIFYWNPDDKMKINARVLKEEEGSSRSWSHSDHFPIMADFNF